MPNVATLRFSESIVRQATWAFWRRTVGLGFPLVTAALAAYVGYLALNGDRGWEIGMLGACVVLGLAVLVATYVVHYRNGRRKLLDMGDPVAKIAVDSKGFTISSGIGSSTLKWSSVHAVWRFDGFWLVLFSKAHFMTLPLSDMAPEMQAFILERVVSGGGRVDD